MRSRRAAGPIRAQATYARELIGKWNMSEQEVADLTMTSLAMRAETIWGAQAERSQLEWYLWNPLGKNYLTGTADFLSKPWKIAMEF